jgi:hypothetical protein
MSTFTAQAAWTDEHGCDQDDVQEFNTLEAAVAWLDDYHTGREVREIWQGRRLVLNLA